MALPFTPRFVDLVRTFTTTEGTGPIIPGAAVQGFSGFAETLSAGDQFYYCIQNIAKPGEREIGRGTLQDDGSVTRDPLSGELTDFATGTKTIALVAAAEWFTRQEASKGGGGGVGSDIAVGNRDALSARDPAASTNMLLCEPGSDGLFLFDPGDHSELVAADPRRGIYIAPDADPSGASGAWVRSFDGPLNLSWFGAKADFVTDDLPAMLAALDVISARGSGGHPGGDRLYVPAGRYYFSAAVDVHCPVHILGAGSAQNSEAIGTVIRFGKNCNGFVFNHNNTHGDAGFDGGYGLASASTLEGVSLWGGAVDVDQSGEVMSFAAGNSLSGHGVRIRTTFVRLIDVYAAFFGGDGFHINSTAGSGGYAEGNANSFYLAHCQAQYNRGSGYLIAGNDSNAGTVNSCSAISNGGCGFKEYSFLGNSYIQCHARDNGVFDPTRSNGPTGTCRYGSEYWYVVAGQEAAASTTLPGTDANVWRSFGGHPDCKSWTSGLDWVVGAPYATNPANLNGRNVFSGCYAEGAQAPVQATYPSLFVGGLLDEVGFDGTAPALRAGRNAIVSPSFKATTDGSNVSSTLGEDGDNRVMAGHHDGKNSWRWKSRSDGLFLLDAGNSGNPIFGVAPAFGGWGFASLLRTPVISGADGDVSKGRLHATIGGVSDLNGKTLSQGEVFYLQSPTAAGPFGYFCTTPGVGGSSAILTPFGPGGGSGQGLTNGDKGDVAVSGEGAALTVESASPASGVFHVAGHVRCSQSLYFQTANSIGQLREVGDEVELVAANGTGSIPAVLNLAGSVIRFRSGGGGPVLAEFSLASGFVVPNNIISTGGVIGYAQGAGGVVVQEISKSTPVTLNRSTGQISLHSAAIPGSSCVSFTLQNDRLGVDDEVSVWIKKGASADAYAVGVTAVDVGSCRIQLRNISDVSLSEDIVLGFSVRRGATS